MKKIERRLFDVSRRKVLALSSGAYTREADLAEWCKIVYNFGDGSCVRCLNARVERSVIIFVVPHQRMLIYYARKR